MLTNNNCPNLPHKHTQACACSNFDCSNCGHNTSRIPDYAMGRNDVYATLPKSKLSEWCDSCDNMRRYMRSLFMFFDNCDPGITPHDKKQHKKAMDYARSKFAKTMLLNLKASIDDAMHQLYGKENE